MRKMVIRIAGSIWGGDIGSREFERIRHGDISYKSERNYETLNEKAKECRNRKEAKRKQTSRYEQTLTRVRGS